MRQQWKRSGKRKDRVKLRKQNRFDGFLSVTLSFFLMHFLAGCFWISPWLWPNSRYWCCLFPTLRINLLCRVFHKITENEFWVVKDIILKLLNWFPYFQKHREKFGGYFSSYIEFCDNLSFILHFFFSLSSFTITMCIVITIILNLIALL